MRYVIAFFAALFVTWGVLLGMAFYRSVDAQIGRNADETFKRVAAKLELEMRTHPDGTRPEYPVP